MAAEDPNEGKSFDERKHGWHHGVGDDFALWFSSYGQTSMYPSHVGILDRSKNQFWQYGRPNDEIGIPFEWDSGPQKVPFDKYLDVHVLGNRNRYHQRAFRNNEIYNDARDNGAGGFPYNCRGFVGSQLCAATRDDEELHDINRQIRLFDDNEIKVLRTHYGYPNGTSRLSVTTGAGTISDQSNVRSMRGREDKREILFGRPRPFIPRPAPKQPKHLKKKSNKNSKK